MSIYRFTIIKKTVVKVTITSDTDEREHYESDLELAEALVEELIASGSGWWAVEHVEIEEEDETTKIESLDI